MKTAIQVHTSKCLIYIHFPLMNNQLFSAAAVDARKGQSRWYLGDPKGPYPRGGCSGAGRVEFPPSGNLLERGRWPGAPLGMPRMLGTRKVGAEGPPSARLEEFPGPRVWGVEGYPQGGNWETPQEFPSKGDTGPRSLVQSHRSEVECGSVYWGGPRRRP